MDIDNYNAKLKSLFDYSYIKLSRPMIHLFGLKAALMLCELCSEYFYWFDNKKLGNGNYFYSTVENIQHNTGLTAYEQREAIKVLSAAGIVKEYKYGMPAKRYFRIEEQGLVNLSIKMAEEHKKDTKKEGNNPSPATSVMEDDVINPVPKPKKPNMSGIAF